MLLPVGVIGMAISTAAFPQLSQQAAREDLAGLRSSLDAALRMILFLAIPASAGLVLLAQPGVRLLLQRGAFDEASTSLVVAALTIYAVAVWAHAAIEILSRGFYALSDTRTPVTFALVGMLINVALCAALVGPLGIRGLAAAASVAAIVESLLLLQALRTRIEGFDASAITASTWRTLLATLVMALTLILLLILLRAAGADPGELLGSLVLTVVCGLAGLGAFLGAAAALGSRELRAGRRWLAGLGSGGE